MSIYGWERGSVTLPSEEFTKIKKELKSKISVCYDFFSNLFLKAYHKVTLDKKGKRKVNLSQLASTALNQNTDNYDNSSRSEFSKILNSLILKKQPKEGGISLYLIRPKKKDFKANTSEMHSDELSISLDDKLKALIWDVTDNNRSVERVYESWLGRLVIGMLKRA